MGMEEWTLSSCGRGWTAAGAFISRGGPGEGAGNTLPNLRNDVPGYVAPSELNCSNEPLSLNTGNYEDI